MLLEDGELAAGSVDGKVGVDGRGGIENGDMDNVGGQERDVSVV